MKNQWSSSHSSRASIFTNRHQSGIFIIGNECTEWVKNQCGFRASTFGPLEYFPPQSPTFLLAHPSPPSFYVIMSRDLNTLQFLFGQAIGDPSHRTRCMWKMCNKSVSKETRNHATILLRVQRRSKIDTTEQTLATATKYMLCTKCGRDKWRRAKCTKDLMERVLGYADYFEGLSSCSSTQYWPTSMCYIATKNIPDEHSVTQSNAHGAPHAR